MGLKYTIGIDIVKDNINFIELKPNKFKVFQWKSIGLRKVTMISRKPQRCLLSLLLSESADKITDARCL